MIEWWDRRIQDNTKLGELRSEQLQVFAVACASHAFATVYQHIEASVDSSRINVIQRGLDFGWRHRRKEAAPAKTDALRKEVSVLYQDAEEDGYNHVLNHIVGATVSALDVLAGDNRLENAYSAAYEAYEAVTWMVFNEACDAGRYQPPSVTGSTRDQRMREYAEKFYLGQPVCLEELTFQEFCIEQLAAGKTIRRSWS